VAVVDDQELIRDGFTLIVEAQPDLEVVLQAADGNELVDAVRGGVKVDVALVDIRMPGMDGLAATRALAGVQGAPAVVIVTTFGEEEYVLEALAAGASGFLLKRCSGAELVAAVRSVAAGDAILSPEVTRTVIERMRSRRNDVAPRLDSLRLTSREVSVLALVGHGCTNKEIAAELFLSESTIKTHIGSILSKTGSRDRVRLALLANRLGLEPAESGA
jgi:DNA-binding NarL/FixJ family response regulator